MRVTWDEDKNVANREKHDVSFEETSALFTQDIEYFEIFDDAHSEDEDRFIAIGPIVRGVVLAVYTQQDDDTVRIISARWATDREAEMYRSHIGGRGP